MLKYFADQRPGDDRETVLPSTVLRRMCVLKSLWTIYKCRARATHSIAIELSQNGTHEIIYIHPYIYIYIRIYVSSTATSELTTANMGGEFGVRNRNRVGCCHCASVCGYMCVCVFVYDAKGGFMYGAESPVAVEWDNCFPVLESPSSRARAVLICLNVGCWT